MDLVFKQDDDDLKARIAAVLRLFTRRDCPFATAIQLLISGLSAIIRDIVFQTDWFKIQSGITAACLNLVAAICFEAMCKI